VLPFVNMTGDPANEFLSDGMTEELLNLLAQVPGLQVAARTSAFTFKGRSLPIDSIGRALRVRHVLEGSVRGAGGRVRITAQLIDATTGYHLWSDAFDARADDVFAVQDSIGRIIVDVLRPRLASGGTAAAARRREPRDPEAHVAAMKGWQAFRRNSPEAYAAAVEHFREAIRRDPQYGYAIAGLATVRHWQASFRQIDQDSGWSEASRLARQALALDSTLVDAYMVLGRYYELRVRDYDRALAHYAQAVAVAPSDARPYARRSRLLVRLGRAEEGLASVRRAVELDPASPATHSELGAVYGELERFQEAEAAYRQALTLDPGHPILLDQLANNLVSQKRYAEAASAIEEARRKSPDDVHLIGLHSYLVARTGPRERALALVDTAERSGTSRVGLASTWLVLGDRERALAELERAVRDSDPDVVSLLDPEMFPQLRGEPRFERLVAEVRGRSADGTGGRATSRN
jgi:TolB-like protein/tetratricopeptide (TPR) repeat protein